MTTENDKLLLEITLGRSTIGAICGGSAVVLAILGLVNLLPGILVAAATIVLGGSLLLKGAAISAEYSKLLAHFTGTTSEKLEVGGGMSVEILTGLAGGILGILALLSFSPDTLIAIAVIIFGGGIVMGSELISKLNSLKVSLATSMEESHRRAHKVIKEMVSAAMAIQVLAGISAIVLGILSLTGLAPMTLNLIAILTLGVASLFTGSAITGKFVEMLRLS